jgi:hypothetical protein
MRVVEFITALLLLAMAVVQFNDPDPIYWIVVYGAAAWVVASHAFGRATGDKASIVLGLVIAGLMIVAPGFWDYVRSGDFTSISGEMAGSNTYVESAREFLGLAIALAALLFVRIRSRSVR